MPGALFGTSGNHTDRDTVMKHISRLGHVTISLSLSLLPIRPVRIHTGLYMGVDVNVDVSVIERVSVVNGGMCVRNEKRGTDQYHESGDGSDVDVRMKEL